MKCGLPPGDSNGNGAHPAPSLCVWLETRGQWSTVGLYGHLAHRSHCVHTIGDAVVRVRVRVRVRVPVTVTVTVRVCATCPTGLGAIVSAAGMAALKKAQCTPRVLAALARECATQQAFRRDVLQKEVGLGLADAATVADRMFTRAHEGGE